MKRSALTSLLAGLVICGCASQMNNVDMLQARIREQALELTESHREIAKTRSELKQARNEAQRMRVQLGLVTPEEALETRAKTEILKVHIYSLLSGGINKDHRPGDDAVIVQFAPFDNDNEPVNVPGDVELTLIDPQLPATDQELGQWNFSAQECEDVWTRGIGSPGYQFTLPLEESPQHGDLVVRLKYTTTNNRRFDVNRRVKVSVPPADAIVKRTRLRKKPVQVFDELDDDLPPVGDSGSNVVEASFDDDEPNSKRPPAKSANEIHHSANWTDSTIPVLR